MRRSLRASTLLWTVLAVTCASLPLKQRVSEGHQAVRTALVAFDDAEHDLCAPAPTVPHDCTNPDAARVGLTSALNQRIAGTLIHALEADKKVSAAIIAWKANDPIPSDLATLQADVQAAFDVVQSFAPSSALLNKAQHVLDEIVKLLKTLTGGSL